MPLTQSSHIIGPLRGRHAGGYSFLPVVPVEVWFNKSIFFPRPKVLLLTSHLSLLVVANERGGPCECD